VKKKPTGGNHPAKHHPAAKNGKHTGGVKHHGPAKPAPKKKPKKKPPAAHPGAKHNQHNQQHTKHHPQHGKHHPPAKKKTKWSPGWDVACCAAEALAASLRRTGTPVTDQDVLALYWLTASDPDAGATIWETITAAAEHGLAGVRPLDARPARLLGDGVILAVELAEPHAVTLDGPGVWTWGEWRPVAPRFVAAASEAWDVVWP
jgi:hypothetical protein